MRESDTDADDRRTREADWKIFRELRELALERFCERILSEVQELTVKNGSWHERYLKVYRLLHKRDKQIAAGFNDVRRSMMDVHLLVLDSLDLLKPEEIARFSSATRKKLKRHP